MIRAGSFGRKQQKNQVDWLIIECLEIDRLVKPREQTKQPAKLRELAVRNCHTIANRSRAELLALQQDFQNCLFVLPGELGRTRSQFLNRLLLAVNLESRNYRVRRDEIGKRHGQVQ